MIVAVSTAEALSRTINPWTVVVASMSFGCTLACYYTDTIVEMKLDLVGLAVVFPLVFSIQSAFSRREQSLQHLARMKANATAIRFAHYHWMEGILSNTKATKEIDTLLRSLFVLLRVYFMSDDFSDQHYHQIMSVFSGISWSIEIHLRRNGIPPPNISRVNESLRTMIQEFELLRNVRVYRTPIVLRAYTRFFITLFPVLYSPLFAFIAKDTNSLWGALVMVTLYSLILTGLDSIQEGLEEPFDGKGLDDVHFSEYPLHAVHAVHMPPADCASALPLATTNTIEQYDLSDAAASTSEKRYKTYAYDVGVPFGRQIPLSSSTGDDAQKVVVQETKNRFEISQESSRAKGKATTAADGGRRGEGVEGGGVATIESAEENRRKSRGLNSGKVHASDAFDDCNA